MKYLFIGMLLNSIVTSEHADREACEGRKTLLAEKGVVGQCIKQESYGTLNGLNSNTTLYGYGSTYPSCAQITCSSGGNYCTCTH